MQIPGVKTIQPHETELIERMVHMMGRSFLEEPWTAAFLKGINASDELAYEISVAMMKGHMETGAPYQRLYALEDESACVIGYLRSELGDKDNDYFERESIAYINRLVELNEEQLNAMVAQDALMAPISDFSWYPEVAGEGDFIHFVDLGVDVSKRGQGSASKLFRAFFAKADELNVPCFLECFSDELEARYTHLGFETYKRLCAPGLEISERCMVRYPNTY